MHQITTPAATHAHRTAALDSDARHSVDFRFRLDVSQLPRPFQLGVTGRTDWNLATSRQQRLQTEPAK